MRSAAFVLRAALATALVGPAALVLPVDWPLAPQAASAQGDDPLQRARAVQDQLREAGQLIQARQFDQAAELVREARRTLGLLAAGDGDAQLRRFVGNLEKQLQRAIQTLARNGIELPADEPVAAISFTTQVAPLLVNHCGRCHVNRASGGLSMASYRTLLAGSDGGPVLSKGRAGASRLIEVIQSGEMPRGGGQVPANDLALLAGWIDQGAAFDGENESRLLTELAAATGQASMAMRLEVTPPRGNESVSFTRHIAPVLVEHCATCHGGNQPSARLGLDRFNRLLPGGNSGPIIAVGRPDESLLLAKLRGQEGARMPLRQPALPEEAIAAFATWVAEGATFDGPDPGMELAMLVRIDAARRMTHDELADVRLELAEKNWRTAAPDQSPQRTQSNDFLLLGNVSAEVLAEISALADAHRQRLTRALELPDDQPLLKGRLTWFVLARRFDYSEFAQMVERRELPRDTRGHWQYNVLDAYTCLLVPEGEQSPGLLVAEQLSGAYVASLGGAPEWFVEGSAQALAARLEPKHPSLREWDRELPEVLRQVKQPVDALGGSLPPTQSRLVRYGFAKYLLASVPRYRALLTGLRKGQSFDEALTAAYGAPLDRLAMNWAREVLARRGS